jgi:WXG100 family type VII secretion target
MADKIQVDYEALAQLAADNRRRAESVEALYRKINSQSEVVAASWLGDSSKAFQTEMKEVLLPAIERLYRGLEHAGEAVTQISTHMRSAEDAAAALFAAGVAGGFLSGLGDFFSGAWSELKDMAGGLWHLATGLPGSLQGILYGITHPPELWEAFKKPYVEAWESGHPWQAVGRGTLFVGSVLIGTKGLDKAGKVAGISGRAGELGRAGEVAATARTAEVAEAARLARAGELADAGKVGRVAGSSGDDLARIAARDAVTAGKGPYLMPEGYKLPGGVRVPSGPSPQMIGQHVEAPVRDLVAKHYGFELPSKPPSAKGPDILIPEADRARLGFDIADVKPLNEKGFRDFAKQMDGWRDRGWPGHGPMEGRAAMFGYDEAGNVYLYGIFEM